MRPEDIEAAASWLETRVAGLLGVYRYGSAGTSSERPDSDLDLAVLAKEPLGPVASFRLAGELGAQIGRQVDLLDLRASSVVMRARVISTGERALTVDADACAEFEGLAYSQYAFFNEERRELLRDIAERGSVYG